jgi:hypothetical protein
MFTLQIPPPHKYTDKYLSYKIVDLEPGDLFIIHSMLSSRKGECKDTALQVLVGQPDT